MGREVNEIIHKDFRAIIRAIIAYEVTESKGKKKPTVKYWIKEGEGTLRGFWKDHSLHRHGQTTLKEDSKDLQPA